MPTITEPAPATATAAAPTADLTLHPKPQPDKDVAMTYEVVESSYRHLWGGYLALARHFEKHGPQEEAARYNEKYWATTKFELELYKLTPAELWTHKTEVLPPLIAEVHALEKKYLGH